MTSSSTGSVHNLPFAWRLSRYDPALRNERGSYLGETWTSIDDVGEAVEGRELTLAEYEEVENAYIEAFIAFAEEAGVSQLEVREVEQVPQPFRGGDRVTLSQAADIVRALLREEAICRLESPRDDFLVHVGFDLYMYVGASRPCPNAVRRAEALGLYVEPDWPSPQLPKENG